MPRLYQHKIPVIIFAGLPASLLGLVAMAACGLLMHDSLNNNFFAHGNLIFGVLFECMLFTHILIGITALFAFWQWTRLDIENLSPRRQRWLAYRLALLPYGLLATAPVLNIGMQLYDALCFGVMGWLTLEVFWLSRQGATP